MRDLSIVRFRRLGDETFTIMSLSPGGCGANSAYHQAASKRAARLTFRLFYGACPAV